MPRLVKTYNEGPDSILEIAVNGFNETIAEKRAIGYAVVRFPLKAADIKEADVAEFTDPDSRLPGETYRVMLTLGSNDKVGDLIDF